jgi:hypothetical protein
VYEPLHRPTMAQLVSAMLNDDPELLHTPTCILQPAPTVLSASPPPILNADSDSFTRTFSDSPLVSSGSHSITLTKTPVASMPLEPLFSPPEMPTELRVHQLITPSSSTGVTPYMDSIGFTPSDSSSSGPASRDEPSLFDTLDTPLPPLFGPGPRRPSKTIREVRQASTSMWPRTPVSSVIVH